MIIETLIGADAEVAVEALDRDGAVHALAAVMAEQIISEGHNHGVDIVADDICLIRVGAVEKTRTLYYRAIWSPDPVERQVMLFGGSHDGETMPVPRLKNSALPWDVLHVMAEQPTPFLDEPISELPDVVENIVETYERLGINPIARQWVYRIKRGN